MNPAKPLIAAAAALLLAAAGGCSRGASGDDAPAVTVLAAASLTDALTEIAEDYRAATGAEARLSFASSSTLAQQIAAGAPADVYASADRQWMDDLEQRGLIAPGSRVEPVGNALALIVPADSAAQDIAVGPGLDLSALLGPDGRIAVGDPDHVPAGLYAKEALQALGLWEAAEPRLARAEDVRGALALTARGETPLGIVYSTDAAISADVRIAGLFPPDSHEPIVYPFALVGDSPTRAARDFLAYATGPEAMATFARYGFQPR